MTHAIDSNSPAAAAAALDFAPVPLRYRRDGWTPARQRAYLAALAETGHAGKAARAVGMTEQSAARLRGRPEAGAFAYACAAAVAMARRRWAAARLASVRRTPSRRFDSFPSRGS